ncbi:MAG: peptide deformylase [Pseudobdellovibrionaceae bacterium]|nr:peptide deformylase [Bdellovibrionales bacterium]USN46186.1 MAG: peptide deformylase [Pseudobdellovibrionaceae bacterium]
MTLLEVLKFPDPRLRRRCEPVEKVTPELQQLAKDMLETMYSFNGIGLAAAQVDRTVRLLVVDTRPKNEEGKRYDNSEQTDLEKAIDQPLILFNPVIVKKEGKTTFDEGCLSVPGYYETVERFDLIEVEALDINGKKITIKTDGLLAICIQHEIDHLDGKLFIDRLSLVKSNRIKSKIKKYGYPDPEEQDEENKNKEPAGVGSL